MAPLYKVSPLSHLYFEINPINRKIVPEFINTQYINFNAVKNFHNNEVLQEENTLKKPITIFIKNIPMYHYPVGYKVQLTKNDDKYFAYLLGEPLNGAPPVGGKRVKKRRTIRRRNRSY